GDAVERAGPGPEIRTLIEIQASPEPVRVAADVADGGRPVRSHLSLDGEIPLLDSRRVDVRVDGAHFARGRELRVAGRDDGTRVTTHAHVGIVERNVRQRDAAAVRRAGGQVEPRLPFWKVIRKSV